MTRAGPDHTSLIAQRWTCRLPGGVLKRQCVQIEHPGHGALYTSGSPETVAQKIAANLVALGANRFDLKYGVGGLGQKALMTKIELYGIKVIPLARELMA